MQYQIYQKELSPSCETMFFISCFAITAFKQTNLMRQMSWDGFWSLNNNLKTLVSEFPLSPRGALAPGSAYARPSAQAPIDTSRNFSVQVSGRGAAKNLKHFLINFLAISGDSKHFSFFPEKKTP